MRQGVIGVMGMAEDGLTASVQDTDEGMMRGLGWGEVGWHKMSWLAGYIDRSITASSVRISSDCHWITECYKCNQRTDMTCRTHTLPS